MRFYLNRSGRAIPYYFIKHNASVLSIDDNELIFLINRKSRNIFGASLIDLCNFNGKGCRIRHDIAAAGLRAERLSAIRGVKY